MTNTEINSLSPTAINEAVARKLGWKEHVGKYYMVWRRGRHFQRSCPNYADSIRAAWEGVEYLRKDHAIELRWRYLKENDIPKWECCIDNVQGYAVADTAPLAICKAFLNCRDTLKRR